MALYATIHFHNVPAGREAMLHECDIVAAQRNLLPIGCSSLYSTRSATIKFWSRFSSSHWSIDDKYG